MLQLEGENYVIQGESSEFANRQKSIFDQLEAVKKDLPPGEADNAEIDEDLADLAADPFINDVILTANKDRHRHPYVFKGRKSLFHASELSRRRYKLALPDFRRNPHKWVKYSLTDISLNEMSDARNKATAMTFLRDLKIRKENAEQTFIAKISFKKPNPVNIEGAGASVVQTSNEDSPEETGSSYFRGSKLIMPEYVVGEKKKVERKVYKHNSDDANKKVKEIKLNHLTEFDDE